MRVSLIWYSVLLMLCALGLPAFAGLGFESSGFFMSDGFTQSSASSQTKYVYAAQLLYSPEKFKSLYVGIQFSGAYQSDVNGTNTTTYTTQDYGPAMQYFFGGTRHWSFAAAYNTVASGQYDTTGASTKIWLGTSWWVRFGYQTELGKGFYLGGHLMDYNINYYAETTGGTTQSVNYSRSYLVPVLSVAYWH